MCLVEIFQPLQSEFKNKKIKIYTFLCKKNVPLRTRRAKNMGTYTGMFFTYPSNVHPCYRMMIIINMVEGYIGIFVLFYVQKITFWAKIVTFTSDAYIQTFFNKSNILTPILF